MQPCEYRGRIRCDECECRHPMVGDGAFVPISGCEGCTIPAPVAPRPNPQNLTSVAVISHNYGHFLGEALDSVLGQTAKPHDILVVDDSSSDNTAEVAQEYAQHGVRYLRVENRHVHLTRRDAFENIHWQSDWVLFLDADNRLPSGYLASAIKAMQNDRNVALVYPDLHHFGSSNRQQLWPAFDRDALDRQNYIDAGAVCRVEAILHAEPWRDGVLPVQSHADWYLWRKVLRDGWKAVKSSIPLHYRKHGSNMLQQPAEYFDEACLKAETLRLFMPLSGRLWGWERIRDWLNRQPWKNLHLQILDTSQSPTFGAMVRKWLYQQEDYAFEYEAAAVGQKGIADRNRVGAKQVQRDVDWIMARIYSRLRNCHERFVCVLEDDVGPPEDGIERLLRRFTATTDAVTGAYRSRHPHPDPNQNPWTSCDHRGNLIERAPSGDCSRVGGCGFGFVIFRGDVLRKRPIRASRDPRVYYDLAYTGQLEVLCDWTVKCQHGPTSTTPCP